MYMYPTFLLSLYIYVCVCVCVLGNHKATARRVLRQHPRDLNLIVPDFSMPRIVN